MAKGWDSKHNESDARTRDLFASFLQANGWRYVPSKNEWHSGLMVLPEQYIGEELSPLALAHIVTMDALARNDERKRAR